MSIDSIGDDDELTELFLSAAQIARDQAKDDPQQFIPFAVCLNDKETLSQPFPVPLIELNDIVDAECRKWGFRIWITVWESISQRNGTDVHQMNFRILKLDSEKPTTYVWRCERSPMFRYIDQPFYIEDNSEDRQSSEVPFGGDQELAELFIFAVDIAKDLAANAELQKAFIPFSVAMREGKRIMSAL